MKALRAANAWLFGYGSPASMGLLRAVVGFLALVNWCMIAIDFDAWFSEVGYVPWAVADRWIGGTPRLNLLAGVTETPVTLAFYVLVCAAALCTMLGLGTRVATIALAIGTVTLHHRNPLILHGGDTVLRLLVLYLALAPSGRAFSLDRWIALRHGKPDPAATEVSLWPQRLVQIQMAIIYFTTVWAKWFGSYWRDGTASWYPTKLTEFDRFPVPGWIDQAPFIQMFTYGTLAVELSLATLVFCRPLRKWVLLAGVLLHGSIEYRFNIPLFGYLMCSMYIAHYEGAEVESWWKRWTARFAKNKEAHRVAV